MKIKQCPVCNSKRIKQNLIDKSWKCMKCGYELKLDKPNKSIQFEL